MFTYYYRNRPPGIGCQPGGFDPDTRESWIPMRQVDGIPYLGQVSYPEPLAPEQVWQYELRPADLVEYAEYVFWLERDPSFDVRADYLSAPRERLQRMARHDVLAGAALIILDAQSTQEVDTNDQA